MNKLITHLFIHKIIWKYRLWATMLKIWVHSDLPKRDLPNHDLPNRQLSKKSHDLPTRNDKTTLASLKRRFFWQIVCRQIVIDKLNPFDKFFGRNVFSKSHVTKKYFSKLQLTLIICWIKLKYNRINHWSWSWGKLDKTL